ncbi:MAG TPA: hypothetical protein VMM76_17910 [Pirellulaceae bacterium]|nr:hypothetical protein [Pirellulaceae bacterium]
MARQARGEYLDPKQVQVVHGIQRCVRQAYLCDEDDQTSGRFWQGRFKAVPLLDEVSLLACAAYVDLNPVRAALAELPELSDYTGAKDRIDDLHERARPRGSKKRGLIASAL